MKTLFPICALVAVAAATPLFANGGGYSTGVKSTGPFRPVNVDSVEMLSEKLDIELKSDAALISIVYQLHNPGAAVDVEMGFPCAVAVEMKEEKGQGHRPRSLLPQLESFALTADGKPVAAKLVKDYATLPADDEKKELAAGIITGWQVVKIPFAAGQTSTIAVSYRNPWFREINYVSNDVRKSPPAMRYLFSAAALWKGPIKSGEVTVRATGIQPGQVRLSHPQRFKQDGAKWTWTFSDFEPTLQDDLEIIGGEAEFARWVGDDEGNSLGLYVGRGPNENLTELLKSGKWSFLSQQFTVTASSRTKLPAPEDARPSAFPWAEGVEGNGIGESVTLTMTKPVKATRLVIANGFRPDDLEAGLGSRERYQERSRVKQLGVSINGGPSFSAEIPDSYSIEGTIDLPPDTGELKTVKLTIEEIYPGTKLRETCIDSIGVEVPLSKVPAFRGAR